jgi:hypothetical protein
MGFIGSTSWFSDEGQGAEAQYCLRQKNVKGKEPKNIGYLEGSNNQGAVGSGFGGQQAAFRQTAAPEGNGKYRLPGPEIGVTSEKLR